MVPDKFKELKPIASPRREIEQIEDAVLNVLKREIFLPLLAILQMPEDTIKNEAGSEFNALWKALAQGTVTYNRGKFSGRFNAQITRALKAAGAKWNREGTFSLSFDKMPYDLEQAIRSTADRFERRLVDIDTRLKKFMPEEVAERLDVSRHLDAALFQVHKRFSDNVKGIAVSPTLSKHEREKIVGEWQENLRLKVGGFTGDEIKKLRDRIRDAKFAGDRYGSLVKTIQDSYGVSANKAKFLARQETNLLTAKYQEAQYTEIGMPEYRWRCVAGTGAHPVRPSHKRLDNTVQRWSEPPITTDAGEPVRRNNPGQDFNCRCQAIPVIRMKR